jgi:hypothetical protein
MTLLKKQLLEKNQFLNKAYEVACQHAPSSPLSVNINPIELGKLLGFDESTTQRIMYELVDDKYATSSLGMGSLFVTSRGLNYLRSIEIGPLEIKTLNNPADEEVNISVGDKAQSSSKELKVKKEVFVTYRWENNEHNKRVIAFVNYLRENGYNASMDRLESQEETAKDFIKMMHQAMTDHDKVIIVLSKEYKLRADSFEGGVGSEYGLIIKDIDTHPTKYILVSFQEVDDNITPLNFKGREVIHLNSEENYNLLHAKLQNEKPILFAEIGKTKPQVIKIPIEKIDLYSNKVTKANEQTIIIHSAEYGADGDIRDVKDKIIELLSQNITEIPVGNYLVPGPEPAYGKEKTLVVVYSINGEKKIETTYERSKFRIK